MFKYRNLTTEERAALTSHRLWAGSNGAQGKRLDWSGRDMSKVDLGHAYLFGAILEGANFAGANFAGANLMLCRMQGANTDGADFTGASVEVVQRVPYIDSNDD